MSTVVPGRSASGSKLPVHVSPPVAAFQRGHEFGRCHRRAVRATARMYEGRFRGIGLSHESTRQSGRAVIQALARRDRSIVDELRGLAAGAGIDEELLGAINARSELLAQASEGECSVIGHADNDGAWLAQNWDWYPEFSAARVLWVRTTREGDWSATFTEAGILAKIGLNSNRVAFGLNLLRSPADGQPTSRTLPVHLALRIALDASSARQGASMFLAESFAASSAVTFVDGSLPSVRTVEVSPAGSWEVDAGAVDGVVLMLHTNHPIGHVASSDFVAASIDYSPTSEGRLAGLRSLSPRSLDEAEAALGSHGGAESLCRHGDRVGGGESLCRHGDRVGGAETLSRISLVPAQGRMSVTDPPVCIGARWDGDIAVIAAREAQPNRGWPA